MVERDISRKVNLMSKADCMDSSVAGSNSDIFFPVRTPEDLVATTDASVLRRGRENSGPLPFALKLTEAVRTPTVTTKLPWFEHLITCAILRCCVSRKLNVTEHVLYTVFDLLFNKKSHYGELMCEFPFLLHTSDVVQVM